MLSIKRDFSPSEIIGCVRSKLPVCPSYECCLKCEMKYECTFLRSKVDKNVATGSGGALHQLHANIQQLTLMSSSKCSRLFKFWKCCQKFSQFHPTSQSHLLLPANQPPAGAATWLELSRILRKVSQCPEKAPTSTFFLLRSPFSHLA